MADQTVIDRAHKDASEGKSPATQAGEFVREEFHHLRQGKHGARSPQQAIAIGLSKARRAGIQLPPPKRGRTSKKVRRQAEHDLEKGRRGEDHVSPRHSRAATHALQRESQATASTTAISRQAHASARRRTAEARASAAHRAVHTKTPSGLRQAAHKAAQTRRDHGL